MNQNANNACSKQIDLKEINIKRLREAWTVYEH